MNTDYNKWRDQQKSSHSLHPSVRLRNRFILGQLKKIPFTTLIDAGCGDGYLLSLIQSFFPNKNYIGVDVSDQIILQNKNIYPGINFFQGDLEQKNITIHTGYDVVVCSEVIEHIGDWKQVIENLSLLVGSGGYLLLTTQSGKRYKSDINIGHIKHFTLSELEAACSAHGFLVVRSYKKGFPFYNLQKWVYEKIEDRAKKIQQSKVTFFGRILFGITYILFLFSIKSKTLGPQIFMLLQKK